MAYRKTVDEKLKTKLLTLSKYTAIKQKGNNYKIGDKTFLKCTTDNLNYGPWRYFPDLADPIKIDSYSVTIILNHDTLRYINSNPINPPKGARKVYDLFKGLVADPINKIIIGANANSVTNGIVQITNAMYDYVLSVDNEESKVKTERVFNRMVPFLNEQFNIETSDSDVKRNYALLLNEVLESGEFTQQDIMRFISKLETGESSEVVIEKQINRQLEWLIETMENILDIDRLTTTKAKNFGHSEFGYPKHAITGPEHLMEKILTDYGQYSLFGVPALVNTNKYVIHNGNSRSQFDLILINHLGDIELVELKRPDQYLLEYGDGRGKFYPSKDLAIAIGQLERYITAASKDNDEEYLINKVKIRDFLNAEIGDSIFVESIRPKGLIIIGSWQKLCKPYDELSDTQKRRVSATNYLSDSQQAYKELKNSLKNISIITYSELLENARTRIQFTNEKSKKNS